MTKIISLFLSAVMTFFQVQLSFLPDTVNTFFASVFGSPVTADSVSEDFLEGIDDGDISALSSSTGICRNLIMIFTDENASFAQRCALFRDSRISLIGWSCPADLYVVKTASSSFTELENLCTSLQNEYPAIAVASPVYAEKSSPDFTPDDVFDLSRDGAAVWNELNPEGSNWYLEAINARQAWDYDDYFSDIKIGVIDTGFSTEHEDLSGKISFPNSLQKRYNVPDYHGTHVAGIIAASQNNGRGIAGIVNKASLKCVDWQPDSTQKWNTELHIFFGIIDLVRAGSKVINVSLGASSNIPEGSSTQDDVIKYLPKIYSALLSVLLGRGYDFVVCQSAGNGNASQQSVDAKYNGKFAAISSENAVTLSASVSKQDILDRIIVVTAAEYKDGSYVQAKYANVGSQVTVAAPGSRIYSCDVGTGSYAYVSGTSMATPMVTAVCALVWSINPAFSGADVKSIVCSGENSSAAAEPTAEENRTFTSLDYKSYPMVNADLSVTAALMKTYSMGIVSGVADSTADEVTLIRNGKESTYTVLSDGSFYFAAPTGTASIEAVNADGTVISRDITISQNETVNVNLT